METSNTEQLTDGIYNIKKTSVMEQRAKHTAKLEWYSVASRVHTSVSVEPYLCPPSCNPNSTLIVTRTKPDPDYHKNLFISSGANVAFPPNCVTPRPSTVM